MEITQKQWNNYISILRRISENSYVSYISQMQDMGLLDPNGNIVSDIDEWGREQLIQSAYVIATESSEATAAITADMYSLMAELSGKKINTPEMEPTPTMHDVAKTVNGVLKTSRNPEELSSAVTRLVKRTGVRTTRRNARRDGAQFAWIPSGDTCAFCIMLASNGWMNARKADHAEHIHSNCDCNYAVRFNSNTDVEGYDPDVYYKEYKDADGGNPEEKLNSMRRMFYQENKDRINAQKRDAYEKRQELNSSEAEETDVQS